MELPIPAQDELIAWLGVEWASPEVCSLDVAERHINRGGMVSGAVTYALVDYGMGCALWPHVSREEGIATVQIAITYVQAARLGETLTCTSALDRRNRRLGVLRSEVTTADGRVVVTANGSFTIFPRPEDYAVGGP